jgi:glycosyltransferase involved in cell wall biosynthesis
VIVVLFMQSQTFFGADSYIHSVIMREFDRSRFRVHAAVNYGGSAHETSAAASALERIPAIAIRPTRFGTSVNFRSRGALIRDTLTQGPAALWSLIGLARYVRRHDVKIIHCTEKPRDAFYGGLIARLTGAKCVVHLHVKTEGWISRTVQWSMRRAAAIIGVSQFVADTTVAMGFPRDRVFAVLNSIEADRWDPELDGSPIRSELGIGADTHVLVAVSRLNSWKGHNELLRALALVVEQCDDVVLLVVVEDDPRSHPGGGSYTAELRALAGELGITDHVVFTGFRSDIDRFMAVCDVYSMPSHEEPFGMVFLEAMCMRKPVAALDNGGTREVVDHGGSGLLAPPGDIDQIAADIVTLLDDAELRRRMGVHGRERAEREFTPQRLARDVERVYDTILARAD